MNDQKLPTDWYRRCRKYISFVRQPYLMVLGYLGYNQLPDWRLCVSIIRLPPTVQLERCFVFSFSQTKRVFESILSTSLIFRGELIHKEMVCPHLGKYIKILHFSVSTTLGLAKIIPNQNYPGCKVHGIFHIKSSSFNLYKHLFILFVYSFEMKIFETLSLNFPFCGLYKQKCDYGIDIYFKN